MAGQLIPRGERRWLVRVYLGKTEDGKRKYRSEIVHGTKKEARERLAEMLKEAAVGALPLTRPGLTVDAYLDSWLDTTARPAVRARTLYDYTNTLRRYVRPYIGRHRLEKLAPADVRAMLVKLQERGLSARTVRMALEVLRNALEAAVAERLIRENPARAALVKKALPKQERHERRTVQPEELPAFLRAASNDRLEALWLVLLFGGLRPSEAAALAWSNVQGDNLTITRVLVDRPGLPPHFAPPKSAHARRAVVLPTIAVEALRRWRKRQAEERLLIGPEWGNDEDLVFTNEIGAPLRQDTIRDALRRLCERAGLAPLSPYALRHSAATLLLTQGVPLKVVSERLGHSTIKLTADVYSHVSRSMQEQAAAALDALAPKVAGRDSA